MRFSHSSNAGVRAAVLLFAAAAIVRPAIAVETLLQNDGYVDGQPVGFQGGFVAGEMAGARFLPTGTAPWRVNRVQFLFGGATSTQTITLRIYDDTAGTSAPGTELYFGDFSVTGANNAMQEIMLTGDDIQVPGQFRVAIEFHHSGVPSVARDGDGNIQTTRNFIFSPSIPGWFQSNLFGLTGDWVIRAGVESVTSGGGGSPPDILSIADIGNDQGRQVRVRFQRSDQDQSGATTPVLHYEVLRRADPTLAAAKPRATPPSRTLLDGWDYVASVPAHGENIYSVVVPTLVDSTIAAGMRWSVFRIRAATAAPLTFFDSASDSGYSVDNLTPAPPANLTYGGGSLSWTPSPEVDFDYYTVYGSHTPNFGPGATLLYQSSAPGFAIASSAYRYYFVTATDFSGNEGTPAAADLGTASDTAIAVRALTLRAAPNPFNPSTVIVFELPAASDARLSVFRANGRLVRTLVAERLPAGSHHVTWDGTDARGVTVGSGSYIAQLAANGERVSFPLRVVR